jgi:hypothetical protein
MIDPIVYEVRKVREALASEFDFDIRKIVEDARRRQASSQSRVVSFETRGKASQPIGTAVPVSPAAPSLAAAPAAER